MSHTQRGLPNCVYPVCTIEEREVIIMIQAYKHMTGLYKVNTRYMKLDTANTRGHQYKLRKERACHTTRRNFFTGRITNTWNSLPTAVAEAPSMNAFKHKAPLDKHWSCFKYSQLSVHDNFNFAKPVNERPGWN